jgi:uncharacterized protein YcbK (DUF882 family)
MSVSRIAPFASVVAGVALACVSALGAAAPGMADAFDTKTASFAIAFHGETSSYRDVLTVVMPAGVVTFNAVGGPPGDYTLTTGDGAVVQESARQWRWTAPDHPGLSTLTVDGPGKKDTIVVHAFARVPATEVKDGLLNGYRIGAYPTPLKGNPVYLPPPGFIEVTRANEDTKVSPHFTLKQFLCKEDTTRQYPKYVVLKERLPLKLEAVLERVNELGFKVDTLHIMSSYRTPYYNHLIGDVPYSLHQFGSAADIYIDPEKRDRMADMNRDGQVDIQDAKFLYDEVDRMLSTKTLEKFQGGMGFYPGTSSHPPFVHVDVRGTAARWKG